MKSLKKLLLQFKNHNLSYALITIGFISMVVIQFTRIFVNRTGIILTLIALIMFFTGIILRICKPKNLDHNQKWLYWTPRIFITLFGMFFTLILMTGSMLSFRPPQLWETVLFILICFVPAFFVTLTLLFSRIWNWIGGLIFILISLLIVIFYWNQNSVLGNYLLTALPIFIIGLLFLLDWWYSLKLIPEQKVVE